MYRVKKMLVQKKINMVILFVILLCVIVIFTVMIASYLDKFEDALVEENSNYLAVIAGHITVNMQTVVQDTQKALESSVVAFTSLQSPEEQRIYLNQIKEKYDFDYVGYASLDGDMMATLESEEVNISSEQYFKETLAGESVIRYVPRKIFKNSAVSEIMLSVPVYDIQKGINTPVGVLVAMIDIRTLNKVMNVASFGGQGHTYVIDMKGEIILHTKRMSYSNLYMALKNAEFQDGYSIDAVISDISSQKSGFAIYSDFNIDKYMYYKYVGIDSWTVVSVVEKNVITAKTTRLIKEMTVLGIVIIILFPALLLLAILSYSISNTNKQAAQAKTAFLANMSHEIRTPMNAIVGISEILLRENITSKQKNYVLSIVNAGTGLLTIINDILDISKIESGKFNIVEEQYELESLIYDIITIVAIKIGDKPIQFLVDLDPTLPKYVMGDMVRVKQVLLNIIGNAVKFTDKGYIKFGIHAKNLDGKLQLSMPIEDTGIGIRTQDLDRLFVSFNQVDTHKNHAIEGTGLGLVISKRLCEMMGGTIIVESEYGKGSIFKVVIKQAITRPEKMLHISKTENFRILILECSDILQEYFSKCMDRMKLVYDICTDYQTFAEKINGGGYTHAIARMPIIKQIVKEENKRIDIHYVALLDIREQSLIEDYKLTIIDSLFTMQLAAVLYNRTDRTYLAKRTGIDVLAIQPMPFIKVLVVDDNEVNIQVAIGLMHPYHMQVDCALSGKKAIELIQTIEYDLIFMDHMMPEMDGVETVKIIRSCSDEYRKTVPIVALTANVTHDAKDLFLETGFDDFLAKPIETIKLNAILKRWVKDKNDARAMENPEMAKELHKKIIDDEQSNILQTIADEKQSLDRVDFASGTEQLGSLEIYCNILTTYCRSANERLQNLPKLLENDMKNFIVEIHGLKGASAGVSAELVAAIAGKLEILAKENEIEQVRDGLPEFLKELEQTIEEITAFIKQHEDKADIELETQINKIEMSRFSDEVLRNLEQAFLDYDTESIKELLAAHELFSYKQHETQLILKLKECYETYNFELPIDLIKEYRSSGRKGN